MWKVGMTAIVATTLGVGAGAGAQDTTAAFDAASVKRNTAQRDRPELFTALQEQLGLKLEQQKEETDVLILDRVELPTEN
jgi:uncharacterized protein (TIGR03435 family)